MLELSQPLPRAPRPPVGSVAGDKGGAGDSEGAPHPCEGGGAAGRGGEAARPPELAGLLEGRLGKGISFPIRLPEGRWGRGSIEVAVL